MTNLEAISATIYPYDVDENLLLKVCIDEGIGETSDYNPNDKIAVSRAAVKILMMLVSMANESNGGYSISYDTDKLKNRILAIANDNGFNDIIDQIDDRPKVYIGFD